MTREDAIKQLKNLKGHCQDFADHGEAPWGNDVKALEMAIKALEQDVVIRQTILTKIKEVCFSEEWLQFRVNEGSNGQRDFLIHYIEQL